MKSVIIRTITGVLFIAVVVAAIWYNPIKLYSKASLL